MSQIADANCVMLELAYLEALDTLYAMQCSSTADLEKIVLWHYRNAGDCPDAAEDCCIADVLAKYDYSAEDCANSYDCVNQITIEPSYCGDITLELL